MATVQTAATIYDRECRDCNFVFTSSYLRQRMPKNASDGRWSVRASLAVQNTLKINLEEEKEADVVQRFRGKGAFIQVTRQQDARAAAGSKQPENPAEGSPRVFEAIQTGWRAATHRCKKKQGRRGSLKDSPLELDVRLPGNRALNGLLLIDLTRVVTFWEASSLPSNDHHCCTCG